MQNFDPAVGNIIINNDTQIFSINPINPSISGTKFTVTNERGIM
jgi:hypothetical protein